MKKLLYLLPLAFISCERDNIIYCNDLVGLWVSDKNLNDSLYWCVAPMSVCHHETINYIDIKQEVNDSLVSDPNYDGAIINNLIDNTLNGTCHKYIKYSLK